jgi:hypothetical protein
LSNIRQLLYADLQRAKAELAKHVSGIRMLPQPEGKKGHYIAAGEWNLLGGYSQGAGHHDGPKSAFGLVAGACFEAIHNALAAWLVRRWVLPKNGRRPNRT